MRIKSKLRIPPFIAVLAIALIIEWTTFRYGSVMEANDKILLLVIGIVSAVILSAFTALINKSISARLELLNAALENIAEGNFDVNLQSNDRDELGELIRSLGTVKESVEQVESQLLRQTSGSKAAAGTDADSLKGEYKKMINAANKLTSSFEEDLRSILFCVGELGKGNFDVAIPVYKGEKQALEDNLRALENNLSNVAAVVENLKKSCEEGNLSARIDLSQFEGGWKSMAGSINFMLETLTAPIKEATSVLQDVAEGNLSSKVQGNYRGDNALIKQALNQTINEFGTYISDIAGTLTQMSNNNLDLEITRDYVGDFVVIKDSINEIVKKLNILFGDVVAASDMVATGARQISDTSNTLHSGTLQQSDAVSELTEIIQKLYEQTQKNAENSTKADDLSESAKTSAEQGNAEMKRMLDSMAEINESSTNISKIIKVIEDIAFQTNLLALNASVEAARAGEHGKGFAVVAEEVRNLAGRTQTAVQETTTLIGSSIKSVNEGMLTAQKTAEALDKIVNDVTSVSDIIEEIEKSSKEQAVNIGNVNEGIRQISEVTHSNSFTAQESAAAAEELSGQSEILNGAFAGIKLKNRQALSYSQSSNRTAASVDSGTSYSSAASPSAAPVQASQSRPVVSAPRQSSYTEVRKPTPAPQPVTARPAVNTVERKIEKPTEKPVAKPPQKAAERVEVSSYKPSAAPVRASTVQNTASIKPAPAVVSKPAAPKPATPKPAVLNKPSAAGAKQIAKPALQKPATAQKPTLPAASAATGKKPVPHSLEAAQAAKKQIGVPPQLSGMSRQNVVYNSADSAIFDSKDFGKY